MAFVWDKLKGNLKKLQNGGLIDVIQIVIKKNEKKVVELNTNNQLFKQGVDSVGDRGTAIEPSYARSTISIKKKKGQPTNRVTLKDTGDFYKNTGVDFASKDFLITNHDKKYGKLIEKYGDNILGLTGDSRKLLSKGVKRELLKLIKRKL